MTSLSDFFTLTFGLVALVFAVTVLKPGAKFSRMLRGSGGLWPMSWAQLRWFRLVCFL